ncbi:hypothetical protein GCM10027170_19280 [Aliiglaciecola aliphaticivorans]
MCPSTAISTNPIKGAVIFANNIGKINAIISRWAFFCQNKGFDAVEVGSSGNDEIQNE